MNSQKNTSRLFRKLLIANRGEIACRIASTAKKLGIPVVAVYSDADRESMHVSLADESIHIGASRPSESYLNADRIVSAALDVGADAIHPGYGFLSENSTLAESCEINSITFIGPSSKSIEAMASKTSAARIAEQSGVPILPGYRGANQHPDQMMKTASEIGYPVLLKSAMGGGGRGMRIVNDSSELHESLISAKSEAKEAFGDDEIIIEKFLKKARHIEVQIVADSHGNVMHLFDRECSAQRRYQKIIEEAPAPGLHPSLRNRMFEAAVSITEKLGYCNVGTIEFLVDENDFYFMEMNTRLQVEHPVTEQITNIDLVEWQLRIAAGESIDALSVPTQPDGHSVELRVYAENPLNQFLPSPGLIEYLAFPAPSKHFQVHTGVKQDDSVGRNYDPLIAKLVAKGNERTQAIEVMCNALKSVHILGLETNVNFLFSLLNHQSFLDAELDIRFVENNLETLLLDFETLPEEIAIIAALFLHSSSQMHPSITTTDFGSDNFSPWQDKSGWRNNEIREFSQFFEYKEKITDVKIRITSDVFTVNCGKLTLKSKKVNLQHNDISVVFEDSTWEATVVRFEERIHVFREAQCFELKTGSRFVLSNETAESSGSLLAPMSGRVVRVLSKDGDIVNRGQILMVIEAMKMEHQILSPLNGIITSVNFAEGDQIDEGVTCVVIETIGDENTKHESTEQ